MPGPLTGVVSLISPGGCRSVLRTRAQTSWQTHQDRKPGPRYSDRRRLQVYHGENSHFLVVNRNKRGLSIDLKTSRARGVLPARQDRRLMVQNYRPGS